MIKHAFLVPLVLGANSLGRAQTLAPTASALQRNTKTAQTVVDGITGDGRGSREDARALRRQSDERLAANDPNGAMNLRWQMLGIRGHASSQMGLLVGSAIQSLALGDVQTVAVHLDAPSCRRFATQLEAFDTQAPSYAVLLRREKASKLKVFAGLTRDPQQWQKTIAGLFDQPDEQEYLKALKTTPVEQIRANIERVYAQAEREAVRPYTFKSTPLVVDPFTEFFASPIPLGRFLWMRDKTQRLLIVAALQARADRLEKRLHFATLPNDPFGNAPLKQKNGIIYSIGPDGKDDAGKSLPGVASKQPDYHGDILAPAL